uniref:CRC domain-containing protein n=2 Tax=Macrostomum lignano TaxID=282301 RepID=A0A1I8IXU2_9PLAT
AVSSICGVSYSAAGDQGENGHHACGYGRAAGQEALGGVVVASAVQEHLHQDQDACGAASVFNGARIALGQGGPSVLHPASRSPVSVLSDWPAMRDCPIECAVKRRRKISIARPKELPGPPAEARMTNAGTSAMRHRARRTRPFGIITLLLFYALVVILVLYVFVEEASNYNILAFVCFVIAFVTAAFILLAAFVEPTLINQSATSWAGLGATCSALSGILLLQATGTQHTQKLLTSNERGDEEGNQHGQLLGFIHKDVGRHHDDGGNIEQASTATAWPPAPPQKKLVYSSRQKPITLKKKASFSHLKQKMPDIREMIEQIRQCEAILAADGASGKTVGLSRRLLAKADRLSSLRRARPASVASLHRNNNKCCNGVGGRNGNMMADAALMEALVDSHNTSADDFNREGSIDPTVETGSPIDDADFDEGDCGGAGMKYPKHQDYCLCHKRKCKKCGCLCPCSEHACPGCGYSSRVVMTMRAVDGLKEIANAQKARFRNGRMATIGRCRPRGKRFLLGESGAGSPGGECSHAVMVRVGGGFVPLVEYLKSHNKVVLSKFTRGDGSAFLSPWRPYYAGPLRKGRPRGIRYVDSVTQQLEELIFANREAGKTNCVCP